MGTGACGIRCDVCRLHVRGVCSSCGSGTEPIARDKLAAQYRLFQGCCPVLKCALDHQVAYCLRDCRRFPCRLFEQGPYPFAQEFLGMQERRRKPTRPPVVSLDQMTQWQQDEIDPAHWEELATLDPDDVSRRCLVSYDKEREAYRIRMLNEGYDVFPGQRAIVRGTGPSDPSHRYGDISFAEALVLVMYLLRAKEIPLAGKQKTENDLPGGGTFFRGPHELPRKATLARFGRDAEGFLRAGLRLGGTRLSFGDAGFRVQALPRVPLDSILWAQDEEFPARLTFAFDATATEHLPLDVIWALVHLATKRLLEPGSESG